MLLCADVSRGRAERQETSAWQKGACLGSGEADMVKVAADAAVVLVQVPKRRLHDADVGRDRLIAHLSLVGARPARIGVVLLLLVTCRRRSGAKVLTASVPLSAAEVSESWSCVLGQKLIVSSVAVMLVVHNPHARPASCEAVVLGTPLPSLGVASSCLDDSPARA